MGLADELGLEPEPTAATADLLAPGRQKGHEGATSEQPQIPEAAATDERHAGHQPDQQPDLSAEDTSSKASKKRARRASVLWAMLMARIFEVLPLMCPVCHGPLKIISFINDPVVIDRIMSHLEMETKPPPLHPARGPPEPELPFEASEHDPGLDAPGLDAEHDPGLDGVDEDPGFDFDQTRW